MSDTTLNQFVASGTNAERLAYTPSPPTVAAGPDSGYFFYETDTGDTYSWDGSAWQIVGSGGGSGTVTNTGTLTANALIVGNGGVDVTVNATTATVTKLTSGTPSAATAGTDYVSPAFVPEICEGRLTTESGVPVSTSDRTAQGTIYFTPCTSSGVATTNGNITLYNGSALQVLAFTELSKALTVTSGKNYDVFVDYNAGTPQLVLSAAWTNDTTRADALGVQNGIIVKSGTSAYRWVGTIRASGSNVTEDSAAKRFVWSLSNQVARSLLLTPSTDSWTYNSMTLRQWNASTANQVEFVLGTASLISLAMTVVGGTGASNQDASFGFGLDSTTALVAGQVTPWMNGNASNQTVSGSYAASIALGYHFVAALEARGSANVANITVFGDAGIAGGRVQSGITGMMWN